MYTRYAQPSSLAKSILQSGGGVRRPQLITSKQSLPTLLRAKGGFLSKTISLFVGQLLITYAVFHFLGQSKRFEEWVKANRVLYILISVITPIILIVFLAFFTMSIPVKLVLFTLFSLVIGFSLAYLKRIVPDEIIRASLLGTLAIFVSMFVIGILLTMMGYNLWWLGVLLFICLIGAIITSIVFVVIDPSKKAIRIKAAIILVLFALFIMYDTNQILQRDYLGDFVTAAIDYYLDVINIVVNFVQYYMASD